MKKPNIRVIIALIIVITIFIVGLVIALVCKFSKNSNQSNIENSNNYNSSNIVDSEDISSNLNTSESSNISINDSELISSSTNTSLNESINISIEDSTDVIPDTIRPTIDEVIIEINFAGMNNLTAAQNTPSTKLKLAQMISDATLGKTVDYVHILDTSTDDKVLIDIYFTNGSVVNYTVLFDTLNTFNFTRCVTTEMYNFIMNGGNLE